MKINKSTSNSVDKDFNKAINKNIINSEKGITMRLLEKYKPREPVTPSETMKNSLDQKRVA